MRNIVIVGPAITPVKTDSEEKMKIILGAVILLLVWSPIFYFGWRIFVDGAVG